MKRIRDVEIRETSLLWADLDDLVCDVARHKEMNLTEFAHWSKQSGYNLVIRELKNRYDELETGRRPVISRLNGFDLEELEERQNGK